MIKFNILFGDNEITIHRVLFLTLSTETHTAFEFYSNKSTEKTTFYDNNHNVLNKGNLKINDLIGETIYSIYRGEPFSDFGINNTICEYIRFWEIKEDKIKQSLLYLMREPLIEGTPITFQNNKDVYDFFESIDQNLRENGVIEFLKFYVL